MSLIKGQIGASLVVQVVKCLPAMQETPVWSLGREDSLEKEMATHSSTLAWKIPWMDEPGRLQSMGSQRVGHNWATSLEYTKGKANGHEEIQQTGIELVHQAQKACPLKDDQGNRINEAQRYSTMLTIWYKWGPTGDSEQIKQRGRVQIERWERKTGAEITNGS